MVNCARNGKSRKVASSFLRRALLGCRHQLAPGKTKQLAPKLAHEGRRRAGSGKRKTPHQQLVHRLILTYVSYVVEESSIMED